MEMTVLKIFGVAVCQLQLFGPGIPRSLADIAACGMWFQLPRLLVVWESKGIARTHSYKALEMSAKYWHTWSFGWLCIFPEFCGWEVKLGSWQSDDCGWWVSWCGFSSVGTWYFLSSRYCYFQLCGQCTHDVSLAWFTFLLIIELSLWGWPNADKETGCRGMVLAARFSRNMRRWWWGIFHSYMWKGQVQCGKIDISLKI